MNPTEAARVMVAWPDFEWRAGMVDATGDRIIEVEDDGRMRFAGTWCAEDVEVDYPHAGWELNLLDDATFGACLGLLEDVLGEPVEVLWECADDLTCMLYADDSRQGVGCHKDRRHARAEALARLIQTIGGAQ